MVHSKVENCSALMQLVREVMHDVYGKQQDEIFLSPKHGKTLSIEVTFLSVN